MAKASKDIAGGLLRALNCSVALPAQQRLSRATFTALSARTTRESYWLCTALLETLRSSIEEPDAARLRSVAVFIGALQEFLVREHLREADPSTSAASLRSRREHGRDCFHEETRAILDALEPLLARLIVLEDALSSHIDHPEHQDGARKNILIERIAVYLKKAGWGKVETYRLLYGECSRRKIAQTAILRLLKGDHARELLTVLTSDEAAAEEALAFDATCDSSKSMTGSSSPGRVRRQRATPAHEA